MAPQQPKKPTINRATPMMIKITAAALRNAVIFQVFKMSPSMSPGMKDMPIIINWGLALAMHPKIKRTKPRIWKKKV